MAADCGTLVVPENRNDPPTRLVAIPVTRIRARSQSPGHPIFRLEGGPGKTNMDFDTANRLAEDHDVFLVGYRGVDGSVRLDCPEVVTALKTYGPFLGKQSLDAHRQAFSDCATRLQNDGVDLAGYTSPTAPTTSKRRGRRSVRASRPCERERWHPHRHDLRVAQPNSVHRSAMIAVNPPGHFLWDPAATDELIHRYARLCANDASCGARTDDLVEVFQTTAADLPDRWMFLPIEPTHVRTASFWGLMESTAEATPLSAPMTIDSWIATSQGDTSGLWFQSFAADLMFCSAFVWGEMASAARADARAAARHFSSNATAGTKRKRGVSLEKLLHQVALGQVSGDLVSTPASRLARIDSRIGPADRDQLEAVGGESLRRSSTDSSTIPTVSSPPPRRPPAVPNPATPRWTRSGAAMFAEAVQQIAANRSFASSS